MWPPIRPRPGTPLDPPLVRLANEDERGALSSRAVTHSGGELMPLAAPFGAILMSPEGRDKGFCRILFCIWSYHNLLIKDTCQENKKCPANRYTGDQLHWTAELATHRPSSQ